MAPSSFPTTSFSCTPTIGYNPRQLVCKPRFLRESNVSLTTRSSCFTTKFSSDPPTAKVTTATPLISTYITGGGSPSSSTNPHFWQTFGYLLLTIFKAPSSFSTTFTQAIPEPGYFLRHLEFRKRIPHALPRLGYITRYLVLLQGVPQALLSLRLQRSQH